MSNVPSPSGTAKVAARRASALLLRVSFMKFPPNEEKVHVQVKHSRALPSRARKGDLTNAKEQFFVHGHPIQTLSLSGLQGYPSVISRPSNMATSADSESPPG